MRLVFLGPPGAGKGTQAQLLAKRRNVKVFASGEILRQAMGGHGPMGVRVARYVSKGLLVPDAVVTRIVFHRLRDLKRNETFVLDGFPRTVQQARVLDQWLVRGGKRPLDLAVNFRITAAQAIRRLAGRRVCSGCGANYHLKNLPPRRQGHCDRCGLALAARQDDEPRTIRKRMVVYRRETKPLIDFYRARGLLRTVPGELEIERQYRALMTVLKKEHLV